MFQSSLSLVTPNFHRQSQSWWQHEEVWHLQRISRLGREPAESRKEAAVPGSQVQLSAILGDNIYNVPSPRIIPPACPPSVFPADGFSRLLNNWLGSGAPQLTDCCPSAPPPPRTHTHDVQQGAHFPGQPAWEACSLGALGLFYPKE